MGRWWYGLSSASRQAIVLVKQAAAGGARSDVANLIYRFPEVGYVGGAKHIAFLQRGCLPKPPRELFVVPFRMVNGVAALHGTTGSVEAGELRIRHDRVDVQLDEPCVLLLHPGLRARLCRQAGVVDRAQRCTAGSARVPVDGDR